MKTWKDFPKNGLWRPEFEKDNCGVGFVAQTSGEPSHDVLKMAIQGVCCVTHRGAVSADAKTGDGAGIQTQLPRKFFTKVLNELGLTDVSVDDLGIGVFFLLQEPSGKQTAKEVAEGIVKEQGLQFLTWRKVPTDPSVLGEQALSTMPDVQHLLLARPEGLDDIEFERKLYYTRRLIERAFVETGLTESYIASFSSKTIVYKGLLVAPQLEGFFKDLADSDFETAIAVFHQRYSTNTFPDWVRAQPFRYLGHNGEINTLTGNKNWMSAREADLKSDVWGDKAQDLVPIIQPDGSDSQMLDNTFELLVASGWDPLQALATLIPEAWQNMPSMDPELRAFFEFQACLSEPWDGPAAVAFSDGATAGAVLDRNGLRPARYKITKDGLVILGSEVGIVDIDETQVVESGRLGPGEMLAVDTKRQRVLHNDEIKQELKARHPYGEWVNANMVKADELRLNDGKPAVTPVDVDAADEHKKVLKAFGFTQEDLQFIVKAMAETGKEPVGSMGDDAPLSILSARQKVIPTYFKQLFAQVTNPAIDPLRERLVMSLNTGLGVRGSMLEETSEHARWIKFDSPLLTEPELQWIRDHEEPAFKTKTLPVLYAAQEGAAGLKAAIDALCESALAAIEEGNSILVLSDKGVNAEQTYIPMLMAVGAVHHRLIKEGKRMRASLVAETGQVWEVHHIATLLGYGANAIHPYGLFQTVGWAIETNVIKDVEAEQAWAKTKKALEDGILKIMSKMGISCVSSYRGAQIFEAIGVSDEVIETCFVGTSSRIGGVTFDLIGQDVAKLHASAFGEQGSPNLDLGGFYRFRRDTEEHAFNPKVLRALQNAVEADDWDQYQEYAKLVNEREPIALRDLLEFDDSVEPVPLEEVESVESIMKRFCTAAMSYGALSKETHEALAIALNRIGGKSNSGEGGEDPARFKPDENGDSACSAIKQVASGRFGVTPEYLSNAVELEIKVAQGSKPGEGGQLPGHKVSEEIARVRHSVPGVTLISPPPHHDIYSIEDLAQLIYDLKQANKEAEVCVKLVAASGVGTIAAGVAKGYADVVHVSGHDGGTGASPISSIKHAGSAWELGVAETQQVLVMNDLRSRILLRTDGGLKTGRDVVVAALLGAEEYNFGTAALVATGCALIRQCHLNTCPVGVATQDPKLREKFRGAPEYVVSLFTFVAQEVRELLASLGARSIDEVVGKVKYLKVKESALQHPKLSSIDWSQLLMDPDPSGELPIRCMQDRNDRVGDNPLDETILKEAQPALEGRGEVTLRYPVKNHHRSVGTRLSHEIALRYGNAGLPKGSSISVHLNGSIGQSFGAFLINGVKLILTGDANDYVGKGMHGGEIVVKPNPDVLADVNDLVLVGNTLMYGATGGTLYVNGKAGERFCVRNSGGRTVVEGVGDHACEYMTGGLVVILGETGRNFGAGMTGGSAFVYDPEDIFPTKYNPSLVELHRVEDPEDANLLKSLILRHDEYTDSSKAQTILNDWDNQLPLFWKVQPKGNVVQLEASPGTKKQQPAAK